MPGVKKVIFLHQPDLGLEDTPALRKEILRILLTHKPQIVCTQDPYNDRYISNPDHRKLGRLVLDMVFPYAFAPNAYPDLVKEVWLWVPEQPNLRVDVTDTYALKEKAICCHRSQIADWMDSGVSYKEVEKGMMKFTLDGALRAAAGTEFKYAESFARVIVPPRL